MSGSQFQQFNEDLNKMLGSTLTVSIVFFKVFWCKYELKTMYSCHLLPGTIVTLPIFQKITSILGCAVQAIRFTVLSQVPP